MLHPQLSSSDHLFLVKILRDASFLHVPPVSHVLAQVHRHVKGYSLVDLDGSGATVLKAADVHHKHLLAHAGRRLEHELMDISHADI